MGPDRSGRARPRGRIRAGRPSAISRAAPCLPRDASRSRDRAGGRSRAVFAPRSLRDPSRSPIPGAGACGAGAPDRGHAPGAQGPASALDSAVPRCRDEIPRPLSPLVPGAGMSMVRRRLGSRSGGHGLSAPSRRQSAARAQGPPRRRARTRRPPRVAPVADCPTLVGPRQGIRGPARKPRRGPPRNNHPGARSALPSQSVGRNCGADRGIENPQFLQTVEEGVRARGCRCHEPGSPRCPGVTRRPLCRPVSHREQ